MKDKIKGTKLNEAYNEGFDKGVKWQKKAIAEKLKEIKLLGGWILHKDCEGCEIAAILLKDAKEKLEEFSLEKK